MNKINKKVKNGSKKILGIRYSRLGVTDFIDGNTALDLFKMLKEFSSKGKIENKYSQEAIMIFNGMWINDLIQDNIDYGITCFIKGFNSWSRLENEDERLLKGARYIEENPNNVDWEKVWDNIETITQGRDSSEMPAMDMLYKCLKTKYSK